ncbi:Brix domain-containing protein-like protein [Elsinoe ampelina]|uniref:Ribosome production factor 2 homolog n=1 Tax=Elsinoe ampelina TaxID=302913 RepID=A0A6A6GJ37_9PEZI|nr:Brix domain-containing protein-like protein [Elsinoe ampelina]
MLRTIKPKNARSKRALEKRAPLASENAKQTLFLRYTTCSELVQLLMTDLISLKQPLCLRFDKKNTIHPFEDASSLEFFSEKNDTSLVVYGSHSKKRPHCLTLARMFDHKVLDMLELLVEPESARTLRQFKGAKPATGLKPLVGFSGTLWEGPEENEYTLARSLLLDLMRGEETWNVDVEGLQYLVHFTVGEQEEGKGKPMIRMRCYMIKTRKSGQKLPRVEVEEMGPRVDFRVGRVKEADKEVWKQAMRKPRGTEEKSRKNIETDLVGDKVGRIHMGKQNLATMQTRKMKGLKRGRDVDETLLSDDGEDGGVALKKAKA